MSDNKTPPGSPANDMVLMGNPAGVMTATTVGIITVLVRELVKNGALQADRFLTSLEELASMPLQAPQTPDEDRMEKKVFDLTLMSYGLSAKIAKTVLGRKRQSRFSREFLILFTGKATAPRLR